MINLVFDYSKKALPRHPLNVFLKLSEEIGELATEINVREGYIFSKAGKDGIIGEVADAMNCLIDILYLYYPHITEEMFKQIMINKCEKWINNDSNK